MELVSVPKRVNWKDAIELDGLTFSDTKLRASDGTLTTTSYWGEGLCFHFDESEIDRLEAATRAVFAATVRCMDEIVKPERREWLEKMHFPPFFYKAIRATWNEQPDVPSIMGRFDVCYGGGNGPIKFYEFNSDTPTSLIEASVVQWTWLMDHYSKGGLTPNPYFGQWNDIHDVMVANWKRLKDYFIARYGELPTLHCMYEAAADQDSPEDYETTRYIAQTATEAGWYVKIGGVFEHIGHYEQRKLLNDPLSTGFYLGKSQIPLRAVFKLFPWETMIENRFGPVCAADVVRTDRPGTAWIQPPYEVVRSNKGFWAVMWEMFGSDSTVKDYLLPTYFEGDSVARTLRDYARKPLMAREGANITLVRRGRTVLKTGGRYGKQRGIVQQLWELPTFGDLRPVLGIWMGRTEEGDEPVGMGIRASRGAVTDNSATFFPTRVKTRNPRQD